MNRIFVVLVSALICVGFLLSCSGGGDTVNPLVPDTTSGTGATVQGGSSQTHLWGYYDVTIDIENGTVDAALNRSVMFAANVVQFLNNNPAALQFSINETVVEADWIDVDIDVGITHPLPGLQQYNGYDVRGVFIGDGSGSLEYNSDLDYALPGVDQTMYNPDGYTRWFNASEFSTAGLFGYTPGLFATKSYNGDATLNPYKYYADGLSPDEDVWTFLVDTGENGVFSSGSKNTRNYNICFPNAKGVSYGYAVVASWVGEDPGDHPANAPEAVACTAVQTPDAWYQDSTTNGGKVILDVSIWDWDSVIGTGGNMEDYTLAFESIAFTSPYVYTDMIPTGGGENYSTYHVEIDADWPDGLGELTYWVIAECADENYLNEFGVPNSAGSDSLASFFRMPMEVLGESPCTDPILDHMNPSSAFMGGALDDAEIIGEELEDGPDLACYLTNDVIDIPGTDLTWVDSQTVTADFDFITAGATEGLYDLYFTDGDGCEVVLVDAMNLVEVTWPVQIADGTKYYIAKMTEDSNGVIHVICSVNDPPMSTTWQMHWFHSEDGGINWTDEGNLWPVSGTTGSCSTTGHVMAADGDGGVYFVTGGNSYRSYICYLDTTTAGEPSEWEASDWVSKQFSYYSGRVPAYWALEVTEDGAIFAYARHYSLAYINRYVYATDWASFPASTSGTSFPNNVGGHYLQEQLVSRNNGIVFNPDSGTFFLAVGGRWDNYYCGAYLLEYNPSGNSFTWLSSFEFHFNHVNGLGSFLDNYFGDVAIDSDNNIHWVYSIKWPTNYPASYYTRQYTQYVICYGTNESGSWVEWEPVNDPSTTYIFPYPPDNTHSDPRSIYRPWSINLATTSDDEVVMTWDKASGNLQFRGAVSDITGGDFSDPYNVLMETDADYPVYRGPQGQGYGDNGQVALVYTSQPSPNSSARGSLCFMLTDGVTEMD